MNSIRIYDISSNSEENAEKLWLKGSPYFYWNTEAFGNIHVGDAIFVVYNKVRKIFFTIVEEIDIPTLEHQRHTSFSDQGRDYSLNKRANGKAWDFFTRLRIVEQMNTNGKINMRLNQKKVFIIYENRKTVFDVEKKNLAKYRIEILQKYFRTGILRTILSKFCLEYINGKANEIPDFLNYFDGSGKRTTHLLVKPGENKDTVTIPELKFTKEKQNGVPRSIASIKKYNDDDVKKEVFVESATWARMKHVLTHKKNLIIQGAPGVGKTFAAKRLAYSMMGQMDNSRIGMVQFHQSYAYEDFVQGIRPTDHGGFKVEEGIFYRFCQKARESDKDHFFIIEEINRGNLARIFGELMLLIEADKRGAENAVSLTYSKHEETFYIPGNVYIIGTMNTADRSLSIVDYALRRRFSFIELEPSFDVAFKAHLEGKGVNINLVEKIQKKVLALNKVIGKDEKKLGKGFRIGHSYFCNPDATNFDQWYKNVIELEIKPLLAEYWFDDEKKITNEVNKLLDDESAE